MFNIGDMYDVKGERLILKEGDETSFLFWAKKYNRYINKTEFASMIQSGEATLINKQGEEVV